MDQGRSTGALQPEGLRERIQRPDSTAGREALNAHGEADIKDAAGKDKKTFGRTPDGTGRFPRAPEECIIAVAIAWRPASNLLLSFHFRCPLVELAPLIRSCALS